MIFNEADFAGILLISLATAALSMSFTQGSMFDSLRQWIATKHKLMGELARCFFCLSHWIAIAAVAIYQPRPLRLWMPADLIVSVFVIVAIATLTSGLMFAAFLGAMHSHALRERLLAKAEPAYAAK